MKKKLLVTLMMVSALSLASACGQEAADKGPSTESSISNEAAGDMESEDGGASREDKNDEADKKAEDDKKSDDKNSDDKNSDGKNSDDKNSDDKKNDDKKTEDDIPSSGSKYQRYVLDKVDKASIGKYSFGYTFTDAGVLVWNVYDEKGDAVESVVDTILGENEYYDCGDGEVFDWMKDCHQKYLESHQEMEERYNVERDIVSEIDVFTGKELSAQDDKIIKKLVSFMQDKCAVVPGMMVAESFAEHNHGNGDFKFAIADINRDGKREIIIDKGGSFALYSIDGNWNSSLIYSDISGINMDLGIVETLRGDMSGIKTYYKYDGSVGSVLEKYGYDMGFDDDTQKELEFYYKYDEKDNKTDVSKEEFLQARYDVKAATELPFTWVPLNPANVIDYFYNN